MISFHAFCGCDDIVNGFCVSPAEGFGHVELETVLAETGQRLALFRVWVSNIYYLQWRRVGGVPIVIVTLYEVILCCES
jgi:hypothetical protein